MTTSSRTRQPGVAIWQRTSRTVNVLGNAA